MPHPSIFSIQHSPMSSSIKHPVHCIYAPEPPPQNVQWYALMVPLRFASAFAARLAARDGVKLDDDSLEMHPVEPVDMQDLRTNPRARRFFDEEDNKEKDNKEKDAKEKDMDAAEKDSSKDSKESKEKEKDGSKEAKDGASSSDKGKDGKKE